MNDLFHMKDSVANNAALPGAGAGDGAQEVDERNDESVISAEQRQQLVCMVGTDHGLAPAQVRAQLALTAEARNAALPVALARLGASGVALVATCNRTELWVSFHDVPAPTRSLNADGSPKPDDPLVQALCALHNVDAEEFARYLVCRAGDDAVNHLFQVACGLRSAIMAEDQVISQVKQAIATSRELGIADSCLEVLFRQAVTAAKQVKSSVRFTRAYGTAVEQAIGALQEEDVDLQGATCMVIGNGEYGRLAASTLVKKGAKVFVTVRQYTHGTVNVPQGCEGIPYAQRYEYLPQCRVVMSATTSPHYTLRCEELNRVLEERGQAAEQVPVALYDLAIPPDIDPAFAQREGCTLHGIDDFATNIGQENAQAIMQAQRLLDAGMQEFWDWMRRRQVMTQVKPPAGAFFPLFVDISDMRAVFVGGGTIALRRIRTLLPYVGDIVVYAPEFTPELERFAADGALQLVRKAYCEEVLDGANLAFACTNSPQINNQVWEACKRRHIPVNVCSDRYKCDFYFPGIAKSDNMVVGISAGGKDHRRVKQLRARIERLIEEEDV